MNAWNRYASTSFAKVLITQFSVMLLVIVLIDSALKGSSPLSLYRNPHHLDLLRFIILSLIPFSAFTAITTTVSMWKQRGELNLIRYYALNPWTKTWPILIVSIPVCAIWSLLLFNDISEHHAIKNKHLKALRLQQQNDILVFEAEPSLDRGWAVYYDHDQQSWSNMQHVEHHQGRWFFSTEQFSKRPQHLIQMMNTQLKHPTSVALKMGLHRHLSSTSLWNDGTTPALFELSKRLLMLPWTLALMLVTWNILLRQDRRHALIGASALALLIFSVSFLQWIPYPFS